MLFPFLRFLFFYNNHTNYLSLSTFPYFITIPFPLFSRFTFLSLLYFFPLLFTFPKSIHVQMTMMIMKKVSIYIPYIHIVHLCCCGVLYRNNITTRRLAWVQSKSNKSPRIIFQGINFSSFFLPSLLSPSTLQVFFATTYLLTYTTDDIPNLFLTSYHGCLSLLHFFSKHTRHKTQTTEKSIYIRNPWKNKNFRGIRRRK